MSVTISKDLHATMVETMRKEYTREFGNLDATVCFATPEDMVSSYANYLLFWHTRLPLISTKTLPSEETVCAHAIASNAIANLKADLSKRSLLEPTLKWLAERHKISL